MIGTFIGFTALIPIAGAYIEKSRRCDDSYGRTIQGIDFSYICG